MTSEEFIASELRERVVRKPVGSGNTSSPNTVQQQQQQQQQQDGQNNVADGHKEDSGHQVKPQGRTPDGVGR